MFNSINPNSSSDQSAAFADFLAVRQEMFNLLNESMRQELKIVIESNNLTDAAIIDAMSIDDLKILLTVRSWYLRQPVCPGEAALLDAIVQLFERSVDQVCGYLEIAKTLVRLSDVDLLCLSVFTNSTL
ncbi:hypothetical protein ACQ4M3_01235 [Leptolyngbya sp. AN03gr2]|uniref:hypothetical protein n=1 Tax=unclassified Leptolyngbya TaxID=2650499 RepID=UPI003D31C7BA